MIVFPTAAEISAILSSVHTPAFVVVERQIKNNLQLLASTAEASGATILLALKGFAMGSVLPMVAHYLSGACASSPHEARLAREEINGEVHTFAPAFKEEDLRQICPLSDHLVFNSFSQWQRWRSLAQCLNPRLHFGLRVNPEHSEGHTPIYDPCSPGSRLGIPRSQFDGQSLQGISGLHFHTLCEHNSDALERTLTVFEEKFSCFFPQLSWVNFGGGHHITRADYDRDRLINVIRGFRQRHPQLKVYLEPGEAVGLNTGVLVASVIDVAPGPDGMPNVILDTSATCHMPDTIEMPYRPTILGAGEAGEMAANFRLGGMTCLAGDVIGQYSMPALPAIGDRLIFGDMAHYTMVKTTTFNGIRLPDITLLKEDLKLQTARTFSYESFRSRLG